MEAFVEDFKTRIVLLLSNTVSIVTETVNKEQPRTGPASTPRARIGPACLSKALSSLGSKGVHEGRLEGWHCGDRICRG